MASNDSYLEEDEELVRERRLTSFDEISISKISTNPETGLLNMMISNSDSMGNMLEDNFIENQKMLSNFQFDESQGDTSFESSANEDTLPISTSNSPPAVTSIPPRIRNSKSNLLAILGAPELQEIFDASVKLESPSFKKNIEAFTPPVEITPGEVKLAPKKTYEIVNSHILSRIKF